MGNRSSSTTYPGSHYRSSSRDQEARGDGSVGQPGAGVPHHRHSLPGAFHHHHHSHAQAPSHRHPQAIRSGPGLDQTTCPQCQRVLLIPPGAPLFRCPCGVLFRTETVTQQHHHHRPQSENLMGRAVMCRRCRRLSVAPPNSEEIVICRCGAPALPLNDVVMQLLAEGELGIGPGRRRDDVEGASTDMIDMLPTTTFTAASKVIDDSKPRPEHGDELSCRVCFEDYDEGDEQRVLPCFHKFHKGCIDEWLGRKSLCPLCNTDLNIILRTPDTIGT